MSAAPWALGIALASAAVAWRLRDVRVWNAIGALAVPVTLALVVYWWPVWQGSDPSEYDAWAPVGVGLLAAPGWLLSLVIVAIAERRHARRARGA